MYFLELPEITNKIIDDLIKEHMTNKVSRYKGLQDYYKGKHDILNRSMNDPTKPNNRLVHDYPGYIIDTIQGYFIGKPVRYTSKSSNKKYLETLEDIFDGSNEPDHNAEIAKTMGICGEAFEMLYVNEDGDIRFVQLPNEEIIIVFEPNFQKSIQMALRHYDIDDRSSRSVITKVEVYLPDKIQYYAGKNGNYVLEQEVPHFFGAVPVIYYHNNSETMGDFEKVITLIDDYNKRISDNSNELEAFHNAYLKIKNMMGTTPEDIQKCKETGAFLVQGDGDVAFIEKKIDDAFTEHHVERTASNIHKFAKVPDLADEKFSGNLSGVAIKYKMWPIEQVCSTKERKFKTALKRRIKLITNILNLKGNSYDWKDIDVAMARNIPSNLLEMSQTLATLNGILSHETLLEQIPFVESPQEELEKIKAEKEESLDYTTFFTGVKNQTQAPAGNSGTQAPAKG